MSDLHNLENALSFNIEEVVAPEIVVSGIAVQIETLSHGFVKAEVKPYDGYTTSYIVKSGLSGLGSLALALSGQTEIDVQTELGKIGYSESKFELVLVAPKLPQYKFRVLFFSYGIGGYPVQLTIEHGTAAEFTGTQNTDGRYECKTKAKLEQTLYQIFNSKRMIGIIQELIDASILAKKGCNSVENGITSGKEIESVPSFTDVSDEE